MYPGVPTNVAPLSRIRCRASIPLMSVETRSVKSSSSRPASAHALSSSGTWATLRRPATRTTRRSTSVTTPIQQSTAARNARLTPAAIGWTRRDCQPVPSHKRRRRPQGRRDLTAGRDRSQPLGRARCAPSVSTSPATGETVSPHLVSPLTRSPRVGTRRAGSRLFPAETAGPPPMRRLARSLPIDQRRYNTGGLAIGRPAAKAT
jgi:hypothetical protein